jgi:hypothetical protein
MAYTAGNGAKAMWVQECIRRCSNAGHCHVYNDRGIKWNDDDRQFEVNKDLQQQLHLAVPPKILYPLLLSGVST